MNDSKGFKEVDQSFGNFTINIAENMSSNFVSFKKNESKAQGNSFTYLDDSQHKSHK